MDKQALLSDIISNPIISKVLARIIAQQEKVMIAGKYDKLVQTDSYSTLEWIEHTQQELTDSLVYLEAWKQKIQEDKTRPVCAKDDEGEDIPEHTLDATRYAAAVKAATPFGSITAYDPKQPNHTGYQYGVKDCGCPNCRTLRGMFDK